jgi:putative permease
VIAYLLDPCIVLMERYGLRRFYGILVLYILLGIFLFFFFAFMMHSQILSVIPECFYRGYMISIGYKSDSRSETLRE